MMSDLIETFEEVLNEFGDVITVKCKKAQVLEGKKVRDERGRLIFDEEEIETIARIKLVKGSESIVSNNVLQRGDAIGLFSLEDYPYLTANSEVILKQTLPNGEQIETNFEMVKPIVKKTHVESGLKRIEI